MQVSVIIPACNAASTIREALDSVAIQSASTTNGHQIEIIVMDDASTDNTSDVVKEWAEHPPFSGLRLLHLSCNSGPATARNRGIAEANWEWIAFLDADNAWLPDKLAIQTEIAAKHPEVALWCGETSREDEGKNLPCCTANGCLAAKPLTWKPELSEFKGGNTVGDLHSSFHKLRLEDFAMSNPVATSTVLVRKDAVLAVGGFDEQFRGPEDYDLWMRIAAKFPVMKIERQIAMYRFMQGSLSMDDRKFLPEVMRVLDKAFHAGGALEHCQELRSAAMSNQLWNASWMAFNRRARAKAVGLWSRAFFGNALSSQPVGRQWFRLLARYLFGAK